MPKISASDGTKLYVEEIGAGTPVVFVHEYAADYRTGSRRCGISPARIAASPTASAAIRPPMCRTIRASTRRTSPATTSIAVMDALEIDKAHVVGHSMGASTALHVGIRYPQALHLGDRGGLRLGLERRSEGASRRRAACRDRQDVRRETMAAAAAKYGDGPTRQAHQEQGPARLCHFVTMLSEHSAARPLADHAQSASQAPDLVGYAARAEAILGAAADRRRRRGRSGVSTPACSCGAPCRPQASSSCRAPAIRSRARSRQKFNAALAEFFAEAEARPWLSHKPRRRRPKQIVNQGESRWTFSSRARPRW